jgi:hypothetical protein
MVAPRCVHAINIVVNVGPRVLIRPLPCSAHTSQIIAIGRAGSCLLGVADSSVLFLRRGIAVAQCGYSTAPTPLAAILTSRWSVGSGENHSVWMNYRRTVGSTQRRGCLLIIRPPRRLSATLLRIGDRRHGVRVHVNGLVAEGKNWRTRGNKLQDLSNLR